LEESSYEGILRAVAVQTQAAPKSTVSASSLEYSARTSANAKYVIIGTLVFILRIEPSTESNKFKLPSPLLKLTNLL